MFGLEGVAVPAGLLLTGLSTVLCAVYGLANWNRGDVGEDDTAGQQQWEQEKIEAKETLP